MGELLRRLGCDGRLRPGRRDRHDRRPGRCSGHKADYDLVRRMRASICVLGPLIARCGEAEVALPGGDNIGSRPLDMHIAGLEKLGAEVDSEHGYIVARAPNGLTGATVWLDFPSVGSDREPADGRRPREGHDRHRQRRPRARDRRPLPDAAVEMGAKIDGVGTSTLRSRASTGCRPTTHDIVPDRIVAGTWAFAAAMTSGDVTVQQRPPRAPRDRAATSWSPAARSSRAPTTGSAS